MDAISIARVALTAMKKELSNPESGCAKEHLMAAMEILLSCRDTHFSSEGNVVEDGESTQVDLSVLEMGQDMLGQKAIEESQRTSTNSGQSSQSPSGQLELIS